MMGSGQFCSSPPSTTSTIPVPPPPPARSYSIATQVIAHAKASFITATDNATATGNTTNTTYYEQIQESESKLRVESIRKKDSLERRLMEKASVGEEVRKNEINRAISKAIANLSGEELAKYNAAMRRK